MGIKDMITKTCPFPSVFKDKGANGRPRSELVYYRCDYDGCRWWTTVWPVNADLETPHLIRELDAVYDAVLTTFPNLSVLKEYCEKNLLPTSSPTEYNAFLDGTHGRYWLHIITREHDYNLYLHCYGKGQ